MKLNNHLVKVKVKVTVSNSYNCKLQLKLQINYNYSYILGYRSYRLITVTVTVFEKVTVTVSVRDYKVAYASFQAGRRPARKLVHISGDRIAILALIYFSALSQAVI